LYLPGVHRAPNIEKDPDLYEIENLATDPEGHIERTMHSIADWDGRIVADVGCGTGFYIDLFQSAAAHVYAIEPNDCLRLKAMARVAEQQWSNASVLTGSAAKLPLRDKSIGIYHSRFAYFWPPDCVPGILELDRVMHPNGTAFIIDTDYEHGEFSSWLAQRTRPEPLSQSEKEIFWASHGFMKKRIESEWRFQSRSDLEAVIGLEFGSKLALKLLANHTGLTIGYSFALYFREF